MSSADNLGKQFGPRSGPTNRRAWSGSKLFDILMVFLKEFFQKVDFEKNQQTTKKHEKLPSRQWVKLWKTQMNFFQNLFNLSSHHHLSADQFPACSCPSVWDILYTKFNYDYFKQREIIWTRKKYVSTFFPLGNHTRNFKTLKLS